MRGDGGGRAPAPSPTALPRSAARPSAAGRARHPPRPRTGPDLDPTSARPRPPVRTTFATVRFTQATAVVPGAARAPARARSRARTLRLWARVSHPAPMSAAVNVRHLAEARRFTADVGADADAVLAYEELPGGTLDLQHTVVPHEARGGGVGAALVRAAVDHARAHDVKLVATCPYVSAWLARHPHDADVFVAGD